MTPPTGTPGVVINGTDFGFDWNVGPDLTLMHRSSSGLIWEGRYFGDYGADASSTIPNITTFRAAGIGITILSSNVARHRSTHPGVAFQLGHRELDVE